MKKVLTFLVLIFALSTLVTAQTPQYYNYNTTNGGNTFPLGTPTGRMVQWLITPGEINQPTAVISGHISKFYCMIAANFGPLTYTNFSLMLGQTTLTALPTSVFYTGAMDTVYKRTSVTLSGTILNWLELTLDHPFAYDSTKSLIIQMEHLGATGTALYVLGHTYLTGKRRTYSTVYPFTVQGQDAYVINFGVDISPATEIKHTNITQEPQDYNLGQNYPNPFNPTTVIRFGIPRNEYITLKIYNALGREISTLITGKLNAGIHEIEWNASKYPSGIYFYRLEGNGYYETKRMMLIK